MESYLYLSRFPSHFWHLPLCCRPCSLLRHALHWTTIVCALLLAIAPVGTVAMPAKRTSVHEYPTMTNASTVAFPTARHTGFNHVAYLDVRQGLQLNPSAGHSGASAVGSSSVGSSVMRNTMVLIQCLFSLLRRRALRAHLKAPTPARRVLHRAQNLRKRH